MRLPSKLYRRLKAQSKKEERSMTYLALVFIKAGLDDRNRGARS